MDCALFEVLYVKHCISVSNRGLLQAFHSVASWTIFLLQALPWKYLTVTWMQSDHFVFLPVSMVAFHILPVSMVASQSVCIWDFHER